VYHLRYIANLAVPDFLGLAVMHFGSGVPLFYAISAFSLMLGYERCLEKPAGLAKFFTRRFFRISPLFYAMLVVWLVIDTFWLHVPVKGRSVLLSVTYVFGFLPGSHEGIVWASWSIGVEWIFYMLFPLFLLLSGTRLRALILFGVSLAVSTNVQPLVAGVAAVAPTFPYMCFPNHLAFFSAGILAFRLVHPAPGQTAEWTRHGRRWIPWVLLGGGLVWLFLGWWPTLWAPLHRMNLAQHWSAGAWIALLAGSAIGLPRMIDNIALRHAGRLSYGLYLLHPPIILALSQAGLYSALYAAMPGSAFAFLGCTAATVTVVAATAWLAFRFIEQPGIHLGERLARRFLPAPASSTPVVREGHAEQGAER
jgi:peptidoglycan/LPS O-acetylase OafA/YrhL